MTLKDLKALAAENGIELAKNAKTAQVVKALEDAGIEFEAPKAASLLAEVKELIADSKLIESKLDRKKWDQARAVLRKKVKGSDLVELLKFERSRRIISKGDVYLLNELEAAQIEARVVCIKEVKAGTKEKLGKEYPYTVSFDSTRGCDMYTIYIDETKDPEQIMPDALVKKMQRGFMPVESDYPEPKTIWHQVTMRESEFAKYYEIVD
jgi:hypothetical protein